MTYCIFALQKLLWSGRNVVEGTVDIFHCSHKFNEQETTYKLCKLRIGCISVQYMRKIWARFSPNAQYMRKIVLLSLMRKICARLYFFLQCTIYVQDCISFFQCAIYAQDLHKIVLTSSMHNICTRFAKIVLILPMRNIYIRLYLFPQYTIYVQDCLRFA